MSANSVQLYNITIGEQSVLYEYDPHRDVDLSTGWNDTYTNSPAYVNGGVGNGIPYRATESSGARVSLTFEGSAIYVCLTASAGVEWSVQMTPLAATRQLGGSTDSACSQWGSGTLVVADNLAYSTYTMTLTVNSIPSGSQFAFYGCVVSVSIGSPGTIAETPITIDDASSAWTYSPSNVWSKVIDPAAYEGAYMETCYWDATNIATASYTGTNVSALYVLGALGPDTTFNTILLNGNQPLVVNTYDYWLTNQQILFFAGGLEPTKQYTIGLQNYDTAYPTAPFQSCLRVDAIVLVHGEAPPSTFTVSPGTSTVSPGTSTVLLRASIVTPSNIASAGSSVATTLASTVSSASPGVSATSGPSASTVPVAAIVGGVVGGLAVLGIFLIL